MELKTLFNNIVDAIHEKDGLSDGIVAEDFPDRIRLIPISTTSGPVPTNISIVSPPEKTVYLASESFDPTGMVVKVKFNNGYSVLVDNSNLIFNPSGQLTHGISNVSVTFDWAGLNVSTEQPITTTLKFEWWSPKMTSGTTPSPYSVTAKGYFGSGYEPYRAFNGVNSDFWNAEEADSWIQFDFSKKTFVSGIRLLPRNDSYGLQQFVLRGKIQGSNDAVNYTNILTINDSSAPTSAVFKDFIFSNPVEYRFYRLFDLESDYSSGKKKVVSIAEIEFYKFSY